MGARASAIAAEKWLRVIGRSVLDAILDALPVANLKAPDEHA